MKYLLLLLLAGPVVAACPNGCEEHEGVCACDIQPFKADPVDVASDEAPRKEQQRQWETGDVKADMPQSLIASDQKLEQEKADAIAEGKQAAGIPQGEMK